MSEVLIMVLSRRFYYSRADKSCNILDKSQFLWTLDVLLNLKRFQLFQKTRESFLASIKVSNNELQGCVSISSLLCIGYEQWFLFWKVIICVS